MTITCALPQREKLVLTKDWITYFIMGAQLRIMQECPHSFIKNFWQIRRSRLKNSMWCLRVRLMFFISLKAQVNAHIMQELQSLKDIFKIVYLRFRIIKRVLLGVKGN